MFLVINDKFECVECSRNIVMLIDKYFKNNDNYYELWRVTDKELVLVNLGKEKIRNE